MIRPEPIFIISGTLQQAKVAEVDRGLPESPWTRHWIWVQGVDTFRGRRDIQVVFGPGAAERRDWGEIVEWLTMTGFQDHDQPEDDAPVSIT